MSREDPAPEMPVGFKEAETREGTPLILKDTSPVNPFSAETEMVSAPEPPRPTVTEACDTLRAKSAAEVTIKVALVECVSDEAVLPVIVSVKVPAGLLPAVVTVSVDGPDPEMDVGTNVAVAPEGNPLTARFTVSVNPFNALTETL